MDPKILSKRPLTLAEVSESLKEMGKERNTYSQRAYDLSRKSKLTLAKATKLVEELKSLDIARMSEEHIAMIATLIPETEEELKTVFAGSKTTIKGEDIIKILEILKKYLKE